MTKEKLPPARPAETYGEKLRRQLKGRVVKSIRLQPFDGGETGQGYDPVIVFQDGSQLGFAVQETDGADFGVKPVFFEAAVCAITKSWSPGDEVEHIPTGEIRKIKRVQTIELGTVKLEDPPINGRRAFHERDLRLIPTITRARDVERQDSNV